MKYSIRKICAVASVSVLELFRRRDVYAAVILALVVLLPMFSVNLFGVEGVVRYIREVTLLLIWIFSLVLTVTNAARQLPGERSRRTILPLLAKPIRRGEVLLGKFLGAGIAASLALLLFYGGYFLLVLFKSGDWGGVVFLQSVMLHLLCIFLLTALVILGSVVLTPSANLTVSFLICGGMLLYGGRLSQMAVDAPRPASWVFWLLHFAMPHFEFFDLRLRVVHDWPGLSPWIMLAVTAYATLYILILLLAATLLFRKQRL